MFRFVEKIRKQPHAVKQQIVFLASIVSIMILALIWAGLFFLRFFSPEPSLSQSPVFPGGFENAEVVY